MSVGVARQWCGQLGKVDNCQVGVFATLGRGNYSTPIDFRLFLPEEWTKDSERCLNAKVPKEKIIFKTKHDLALEMVFEARKNGPVSQRPFKTNWFHLGADIANSSPSKGLPADAGTVLDSLSIRSSFLMVGTLEPRKGHEQVLGAFEHLWRSGHELNLVIVGKQGWLVESLVERLRSHAELNKRLRWLEGISDEYLANVYTSSTCLIAASYGEGFGLPLVEASQNKLPIMARDIPVFREVAGDHAYYFAGKSPDDLAHAITSWLALYHAGKHPKSNDMPWLTWKESAQQLKEQLSLNGIH